MNNQEDVKPPHRQRPFISRPAIGVLVTIMLAGGILTGGSLGSAPASPLTANSAIVQRALALLAAHALSGSPANPAPTLATTESSPVTSTQATRAPLGRSAPAARKLSSAASVPSSSPSKSSASAPSPSQSSSSEAPHSTTHTETPTEGAGDPNDYQCQGHMSAGTPEAGSDEQQVRYQFACSGPITGYQLQTQVPLSGFEASPLVTNDNNEALTDSFSCGGEVPGFAVNCVGSTKVELETIVGQFAIGTALCAAPHVDPLLTVTYAYLEKTVVTQAISGPFDLGRPRHCPASSYRGGTRLNPVTSKQSQAKRHKKTKGNRNKATLKSNRTGG